MNPAKFLIIIALNIGVFLFYKIPGKTLGLMRSVKNAIGCRFVNHLCKFLGRSATAGAFHYESSVSNIRWNCRKAAEPVCLCDFLRLV